MHEWPSTQRFDCIPPLPDALSAFVITADDVVGYRCLAELAWQAFSYDAIAESCYVLVRNCRFIFHEKRSPSSFDAR